MSHRVSLTPAIQGLDNRSMPVWNIVREFRTGRQSLSLPPLRNPPPPRLQTLAQLPRVFRFFGRLKVGLKPILWSELPMKARSKTRWREGTLLWSRRPGGKCEGMPETANNLFVTAASVLPLGQGILRKGDYSHAPQQVSYTIASINFG